MIILHFLLLKIYISFTLFSTIEPDFTLQLRLEEERCKEAEARVRELEKQVIVFFRIGR